MRVMLLCSSFNGLTQRVWLDLRAAGHDVRVELSSDMDAVRAAALTFDPALIVCPFLRERVPDDLWMRYRTIIIHPGPIGDRGPPPWTGRSPMVRQRGASRPCRRFANSMTAR